VLEGGKIVISKLSSGKKVDRRERLLAAAARVRASMPGDFRAMTADEIMEFIRPADPARGRTVFSSETPRLVRVAPE
jgi:hypothetical protein